MKSMVSNLDKITYQQRLKKLLQKKKINVDLSQCCNICGEDDPAILKKFENHHIFGKSNSNEIILLCPNCHIKITDQQNKLPKNIRKCSNPRSKLKFKQLSTGVLLKRIGEELIKDANSC